MSAYSEIAAHFAERRALPGAAPAGTPVGDITEFLAAGNLDPAAFEATVDRHGVRGDPAVRRQTLDLVLGYVERALDDGALTADEQADCRALRTFLRVRDGEFLAVRRAEVARLLDRQLERILADEEVDSAEDLYQVELQTVFGLGYDDYLALTRSAFERVRARLVTAAAGGGDASRAASAKLSVLEPAFRLAAATQPGAVESP